MVLGDDERLLGKGENLFLVRLKQVPSPHCRGPVIVTLALGQPDGIGDGFLTRRPGRVTVCNPAMDARATHVQRRGRLADSPGRPHNDPLRLGQLPSTSAQSASPVLKFDCRRNKKPRPPQVAPSRLRQHAPAPPHGRYPSRLPRPSLQVAQLLLWLLGSKNNCGCVDAGFTWSTQVASVLTPRSRHHSHHGFSARFSLDIRFHRLVPYSDRYGAASRRALSCKRRRSPSCAGQRGVPRFTRMGQPGEEHTCMSPWSLQN